MNWCMCLSIYACISSLANAWWSKSESKEHGSSQQPALALRENREDSKIIASSNNDNDRLDFLERELKKVNEENKIFRSRLFDLGETMKQFQIYNVGSPESPVKTVNEVMKHTKDGITDRQITKRVDEILSKSPGTNMSLEGQEVKGSNDRRPVAFFARLSNTLHSLGRNQIIHFKDVVTNIGGGYHIFLGIFIAPVNGLYVFHVGAMVAPGKAQYISIVKDGSSIQLLYPNAASTYGTHSVTIVLEVSKGSAVWVRAESGSGYLHGYYCIFSGWLLSPL